jgi:hypothetical protein
MRLESIRVHTEPGKTEVRHTIAYATVPSLMRQVRVSDGTRIAQSVQQLVLCETFHQVRTQNFSWEGGPDSEAVYSLCLILKIML